MLKTINIGTKSYFAVPPTHMPPAPAGGPSRAWYQNLAVKPPRPNRAPVRLHFPDVYIPRRGGGPPVLNMKPNGEFDIMGTRKGVSLPGYKGALRGPVLKSALRLGLAATRFTPMRFAQRVAFNMLHDVLDQNGPWAQWIPEEPSHYDLSDFTHHCHYPQPATVCGSTSFRWESYSQAPNLCGINLQVTHGKMGDPMNNITTRQGVAFMLGPTHPIAGCGPRFNISDVWFRRGPGTALKTYAPPRLIPARAPIVLPTPSIPHPVAISESYTPPSRARRERVSPYARRAVNFGVNSDGSMKPPSDGYHTLRRPNRNEKEKKGNVSGRQALALLGAVYDSATEAVDIVNVLYSAMDKRLPWRPGNPYHWTEKALFIYQNLGHLNIQRAVTGLIRNHLEDKFIYGKIYGTIGKHTGFGSMGPGHGGWLKI